MKTVVLGFWFSAWSVVCCAQPLPFDPTPLEDVVQDRAGRIWGIHRDTGLSRWDGQRWQATKVMLPGLEIADPPTQVIPSPHAFPLLLQTNLQGTAYVCWAGSDGFAAINISTTRLGNATALFDGQRWETAPFRSAGIRDPFNLSRPPGGRSRDGTLPGGVMPGPWKAERQQLIHTESGISIPQFRMEEVHPFLGARRVDQVWTDARGNLVLSTQLPAGNLSGHRQYVVLAPLDSKAPPRLELVKVDPGGVGVELHQNQKCDPSDRTILE